MDKCRLILLSEPARGTNQREVCLGEQDHYTFGQPGGSARHCLSLPGDKALNPLHATLTRKEHRWWLQPEKKSSTFLNGNRLNAGAYSPLKEYDIITL